MVLIGCHFGINPAQVHASVLCILSASVDVFLSCYRPLSGVSFVLSFTRSVNFVADAKLYVIRLSFTIRGPS